MKVSIAITLIFGFLSIGCTTTYLNIKENSTAQIEEKINDYQTDENLGAEVILSIKNGEEISGELLSVRENSLIVCSEHSATEVELTNLKYPINTVRYDEIKEITIEGSNYIWIGLGIGVAAGTGIGILIGQTIEPTSHQTVSNVLIMGFLGFLVGLVAGPTIGYFSSTDDVILQEIPPGYKFLPLKSLARYPDEEPEYLRAIK